MYGLLVLVGVGPETMDLDCNQVGRLVTERFPGNMMKKNVVVALHALQSDILIVN